MEAQARGGALLDGKLEEYERAWKAAGGEDITSDGLEDLFVKLGQPLDAERLAQVRQLCRRLPGLPIHGPATCRGLHHWRQCCLRSVQLIGTALSMMHSRMLCSCSPLVSTNRVPHLRCRTLHTWQIKTAGCTHCAASSTAAEHTLPMAKT